MTTVRTMAAMAAEAAAMAFGGEGYCLCWRARSAEASDRKHETNISARWRMAFRRDNDRPLLVSVPMKNIHKTLWVYQHFAQSPRFPQGPVNNKEDYTIEEAYTRYEWALNYLDRSRWEEATIEDTEVEDGVLGESSVVVARSKRK